MAARLSSAPGEPGCFDVGGPGYLSPMPQDPSDVPAIDDWSALLRGKVAVVTGGGDGIGGAISRLFAEHGAQVEIAEIDPERADRKVAEIEAAGGAARAHVVDVRLDDDVARLRDDGARDASASRRAGQQRRRLPAARAVPRVPPPSRGTRCTRSTCATSSR